MHILVCDDDAVFAAQMDEYISEWFRAREIQVQSTVCTSGEQLLATPELERYQLAFLDVDLKTTDGIALGRKLRQVAPDIVLVYISAYLEFAPQGYTVNAYRYLLKRDIAAQLPSCLEDIFAGMTDPKKTLEVRHNRTTSEIPLDQIYYLESNLRQINVYGDIPHQPICTFYGKIADLPAMLYENGFLQVGRSDVVNLQYVRSIRNYKVELRSGVELNASRQDFAAIRSAGVPTGGLCTGAQNGGGIPSLGAQSGATGCGAAAGWAVAPHHPQRARPRHGAFQRAGCSAAPWCGVYPELPGQLVPLYLCGAHRQFMTSAPSEYDSFCATQA